MGTQITYQYLMDFYSLRLQERLKEKAPATIKVIKSYLGLIHDFTGKTWESAVEQEFLSEQEFERFLSNLAKTHGASTIASVKSKLGKVREVYLQLSLEQNLPDGSFSAVVGHLVKNSGKSISQVARDTGIKIITLDRWILGKHLPEAGHLNAVAELEKYFGLPADTLLNKLGSVVFGQRTLLEKQKSKLSHSDLSRRLKDSPYRYKLPGWGDELKREFDEIYHFYTDPIPSGPNTGLHRTKDQRWKIKHDKCSTRRHVKTMLETFFGALTQPCRANGASGLGIPKELMSLVLITNPELLEAFMRFQQVRIGKITTGSEQLLKRALALLTPVYGFLRQRHDLASRYGILGPSGGLIFPLQHLSGPRLKDEWEQTCNDNYNKILHLLNSTDFAPYRDTKEPIRKILDSGDIAGELKSFISELKGNADASGIKPWEQARRQRDFLLVLFHFLFEFRSEHYSYLEIGRHLIKRNGLWAMKIYPEEFKSSGVFTESEFCLDLPSDVSRWINIYIDKYRPHLHKSESSYLFLASRNCNQERRTSDFLPPKSISKIFRKNTIWFSSSETGFSSQAARKLVSTMIHKKKVQDAANEAASAMAGHTTGVSQKYYQCHNAMQASFLLVVSIFQAAGIFEASPDTQRAASPGLTITKLQADVQRLEAEKQALTDALKCLALGQKKTA